ncbi:FAD-binding protein [Streptomyces sp. KL116D]|uniref:FAD-binding protein n=1 Tax=Streptomyces sp. KL116D TaxID=3045152 RepID=UPI003557C69A
MICKSLFGKAHTVMAEGGIAAAMGNVNSGDNWQVHFRDTMRGGKFLNQWRMAELHATEAPTASGSWRPGAPSSTGRRTGGSRSATSADTVPAPRARRRPHRPRTHPHAPAEDRGAAAGGQEGVRDYEARLKVFQECTVTRSVEGRRGPGLRRLLLRAGERTVLLSWRRRASSSPPAASAEVLQGDVELLGVHRRRARARAARRGSLLNMEFVRFHPTGMVWPPSVKGILVTESVRGDGGVLKNSEGKRFMFDYIPDVFKEKYAESEAEGDRWYDDPDHNRRPPNCCPATRSPGPSTPR